MIRRKLNEDYNLIMEGLTNSYLKRYEFTPKEELTLFNTLFEDVNDVHSIFIHTRYNDSPELFGEEFFDEVLFNDGETHTFLIDKLDNKLLVTEVKLTENMLKHKEFV